MKNIVLTGVTGGIGRTIAKKILESDEVTLYGFSRSESAITHKNYHHFKCNLENLQDVELQAKKLKSELDNLHGIIIAAGFGRFIELEQFSVLDMQTIMNVNFLSQAIFIKTLLPVIKKTKNAKIIAIVSESSTQGARKGTMYCASKFATRGFLQSLRAECNHVNTAVTIINPGFVKTEFFNHLNFEPGEANENHIKATQIAKTIEFILEMENNCVLEEINIQPMKKVIKKK